MKKFISIILSAAVLFSTCVANAAGTKITATSADAAAGDVVDITFAIENNPGVAVADITLSFDGSVLSLVSVPTQIGTVFNDGNITEDKSGSGRYSIVWSNDENVAVDGELFTLEFKVADDARISNYFISIGINELKNASGDDVRTGFSLPNISVISEETPTETPTATARPTSAPAGGGGGGSVKPTATPTVEPTVAPTEHPEPMAPEFSDVEATDWYYEYVTYVCENGLMSGISDDEFAAEMTLTRAMLVTVLWRMENEPIVNYLMQFTDVEADGYYQEAVRWATSEGIITGYDDVTFAPNDNMTREQIATVIYRYAQHKEYDVSVGENTNILSYDDFDSISEYAISAMQYTAGAGIINGKTESTLNPKDNATRAEIAAILQRFIEGNK